MVATPAAVGVTHVEAFPPSSVVAEQLETPPQADNVAAFVLLHPIVAPHTGVIPSEVTTRTLTGFIAWVPSAAGGFEPCNKSISSLAAAP
jgi:hypothetical protein